MPTEKSNSQGAGDAIAGGNDLPPHLKYDELFAEVYFARNGHWQFMP